MFFKKVRHPRHRIKDVPTMPRKAAACPFCPKEELAYQECMFYNTFDDALEAVGAFGRYQVFLCFLLLYSTLMWEGNFALDAFFNRLIPMWRCLADAKYANATNEQLHDRSFVCEMTSNCPAGNLTVVSRDFYSIAEEWVLTCEHSGHLWLMSNIDLVLLVTGYLLAGHVGDQFGRKRYLYVSQYCFCIVSVLSIACRGWRSYTVMTSISTFFYAFVETTGLILALEYTNNKYRLLMNVCFETPAVDLLVAPIAYLTGTWRMYLTVINFITCPLLLGYLLIHESPRWVIQKGDLTRAATIMTEIGSSRWNRRDINIEPDQIQRLPSAARRKARFYHAGNMVMYPSLRLMTLCLAVAMIAQELCFHAFHPDIHRIVVDPFAQFALTGAMHLWIPVILLIMDWKMERFGRRAMLIASLIIMTVCHGAVIVVRVVELYTDLDTVKWNTIAMAFTLIGSGARVSICRIAVAQVIAEFYPTVIRCTAMGTITACGHAASILLGLLRMDPASTEKRMVMMAIAEGFTVAALILCALFQVETKHMRLRDTIEECEEVFRKRAAATSSTADNTPSTLRTSNGNVPSTVANSELSLYNANSETNLNANNNGVSVREVDTRF